MIAEEAPPGMIALSFFPPRIPPQYSSSRTRKVVPIGASCTPGRFTWPLTAYRRVPPFFGAPPPPHHPPPLPPREGECGHRPSLLTPGGRLNTPPPRRAGSRPGGAP